MLSGLLHPPHLSPTRFRTESLDDRHLARDVELVGPVMYGDDSWILRTGTITFSKEHDHRLRRPGKMWSDMAKKISIFKTSDIEWSSHPLTVGRDT